MSSESSLLGAMPPSPILRSSTSAPMSSVIVRSRRQASSVIASSRRLYQWASLAMPGTPAVLIGLGEELPQLWPGLRALADHSRPAGFVGFAAIEFSLGAIEPDRLNPRVGLTLGVLRVLLLENRRCICFGLLTRLAQNIALSISELVPCGLVHQDG